MLKPAPASAPRAQPEALIEEARARQRRRRLRLFIATVAVVLGLSVGIGWGVLGIGDAPSTGTSGSGAASSSRPDVILIIDFNTVQAGGGQATPAEEDAVEHALSNNPHIAHLTYISREAAYATMKRQLPHLVAALPFNPLPDEYRVTVPNRSYAHHLAQRLGAFPGVRKVTLGRIVRR